VDGGKRLLRNGTYYQLARRHISEDYYPYHKKYAVRKEKLINIQEVTNTELSSRMGLKCNNYFALKNTKDVLENILLFQ
jgi:hypothetical protein